MWKYYSFFLLLGMSVFGCKTNNQTGITPEVNPLDSKIIAYVFRMDKDWSLGDEKVKQITHFNYAFANIKNGKVIEGRPEDSRNIKKLVELKKVNPDLKILISVGGWGWSDNFSDAVLTEEAREIFATSAVDFMLKHKIDGVDLDWEYPGQPGEGNVHRPEDKENFTAILKLIREKLDAISTKENPYLLTIATGANQTYLDHTDMKVAHQYLDFINIMTYDFHGSGEKKTGHNANLFVSKYDDNKRVISCKMAVDQHITAGIPAEKIVLGVPFYGKFWKGANNKNNGLYQPITGKAGGYSYTHIKEKLLTDPEFEMHWDTTAAIPFLWRESDGQFVTYENPESIKHKVKYVKENDLGGIMFWQLNSDDGTLLKAVYDHLSK